MITLPQDLIDAFIDLINDVFTQRVREGKIDPAREVANFQEFENQYMQQYQGNDLVKHTTIRHALQWLENYIDTSVDLQNPDAIKNIKYITFSPTQSPDEGELQAVVEPLILTQADQEPEVPTDVDLKPGQDGWDWDRHILKGQLVLNDTDNRWYYRRGNAIIDLREGLELAFEHVTGLTEWQTEVDEQRALHEQAIQLLQDGQNAPNISFKQYFTLSSVIETNYQQNVNRVLFGAGLLTHFGLVGGIKQWVIPQSIQTLVSEVSLYYMYAKCSKTTNEGSLLADLNILADDDNFYYFLVGTILPVINGVRNNTLTNGIPSVNASQIKVGRIVSSDGSSYFDLNTGVMVGKFNFLSGSTGIDNVLTVGGRNLVRNSAFKLLLANWAGVGNHSIAIDNVNTYNSLNTLKITASGAGDEDNEVRTTAIGITEGKQYVLTFWGRADAQTLVTAKLNGSTLIGNGVVTLTPTWQRFLIKMTASSSPVLDFKALSASAVNIMNVKLEEGNVATDWTNAPEDTDTNFADLKTYVDTVAAGLQSQVDRVVEQWFKTYDPTLENEPASLWTTEADKNKHLGDLFYNSTSGNSWRFNKTELGVYEWAVNNDVDISAALAAAAAAQDTADSKRRIFTSTPTDADAYDVGDLWAKATAGSYTNELLVCKTAKTAGATFSIDHWEKASKYTDDTAANNAQATANAKSRSFSGIDGDVPVVSPPNYKVGDTWQDGTDLKICVSVTGNLTADFVKRVNYDSTVVTIGNGVVTAGSIRVKDANNVEWAGMRGATGTDGSEIGIWAGASMANRATAPFRVTHNGYMYATQGNIAGWTIAEQGLYREGQNAADSCGMVPIDWPFYAGSQLLGRATAPFRVSKDGSMYASKGEIGGWNLTTAGIYKDFETTGSGMAPADYPFYAGKKFTERTTAPFRVAVDGSVYMSKATIENATIVGGSITAAEIKTAATGKRIEISASGVMNFFNASGDYARIDNDGSGLPGMLIRRNSGGLMSLTPLSLSLSKGGNIFNMGVDGSYLNMILDGLPRQSLIESGGSSNWKRVYFNTYTKQIAYEG